MMGPLGCFFSLILGALLFVVILVLLAINKIASMLGIQIPWTKWFKIQFPGGQSFGGQPFGNQPFGNANGNASQQQTNRQSEQAIPKSTKYDSSDGEYVDFEEIKD